MQSAIRHRPADWPAPWPTRQPAPSEPATGELYAYLRAQPDQVDFADPTHRLAVRPVHRRPRPRPQRDMPIVAERPPRSASSNTANVAASSTRRTRSISTNRSPNSRPSTRPANCTTRTSPTAPVPHLRLAAGIERRAHTPIMTTGSHTLSGATDDHHGAGGHRSIDHGIGHDGAFDDGHPTLMSSKAITTGSDARADHQKGAARSHRPRSVHGRVIAPKHAGNGLVLWSDQ